MDEIDIPQYFLCPISLQIMKDPVTIVTGITYDRESIEQWLSTATSDVNATATAVCPVTKQPLIPGSDLTPNHMLRKLIQAWCIANGNRGVDRIPTPKSPLQRSLVLKLIRDVNNNGNNILRSMNGLRKLDELVFDDERNHMCMKDARVVVGMIMYITKGYKEGKTTGLEEALRIFHILWSPTTENKKIVEDNFDLFVQAIVWILRKNDIENTVKTLAVSALRNAIQIANPSLTERLDLDFFIETVNILRKNKSPQALKSALHVLIDACPSGRNRTKIVEAGAVHKAIELELGRKDNNNVDKRTTELIFCLLAQLCSCADGRQQFLKHAGGIALVAKRLLRISPTTDDRALCLIESIARFSATREVVMEMLRVGAVSKLCMVLQADCADYLKKKAREILRLHSNAWSNSPCIQVYLLTRYTR